MMSIQLGDHFEEFIRKQIELGRYTSTSEVIKAALTIFESQTIRSAALIEKLSMGLDSGFKYDRDPNLLVSLYDRNMAFEFLISKLAEEDIKRILLFINQKGSAEMARQTEDLICRTIEELTDYPYSGPLVRPIKNGFRFYRIKALLFFYRVDEYQQLIEIIRVLHVQLDLKEIWMNDGCL